MKENLSKNRFTFFQTFFFVALTLGLIALGFMILKPNLSINAVSENNIALNQVSSAVVGAENGLVFTFTESSTGTEITSNAFTSDYNGKNFNVSVEVNTEGATISGSILYQWYYSSVESSGDISLYTKLDGKTGNELTIKNCSDSGYYVLQVSDDNGIVGNSTPINIAINPKQINISGLTAREKVYDGLNNVYFDFKQDVQLFEQDANIVVMGQTKTADAGEGKLVSNISANINKENLRENYKLVLVGVENISADILRKPVSITASGNFTTTYDGQNHKGEINFYYQDINKDRKIVKFDVQQNNLSVSELKNAGEYQIVLLPSYEDGNYIFYKDTNYDTLAESYLYKILRASSEIELIKDTFVYTGEQQDVREFFIVNNNEQQLIFSANTTFTTVSEGNSLGQITVTAKQSTNYKETTKSFNIVVDKATPSVDLSGLKKDYVYNGRTQSIDTSGVFVNDEQQLSASTAPGNVFCDAGIYDVMLTITESENYKSLILEDIQIEIAKKQVDVSTLTWTSNTYFQYEIGKIREITLRDIPSYLVPTYSDNQKEFAGVYVATVSFTLTDEKNYEIIGEASPCVWEIAKRIISIPLLSNDETTFVYNGDEQGLNLRQQQSSYYVFVDNKATNAGDYVAKVCLKDPDNTTWANNTVDDVLYPFKKKKKIVALPKYEQNLKYTGTTLSLDIKDTEVYNVYGQTNTNVGDYTAVLVLKDINNYAFEDTQLPYVELSYSIIPNNSPQEVATPIVAIVVSIIMIVVLGVFITLQLTVVRKKQKVQQTASTTNLVEDNHIVQSSPSSNLNIDTNYNKNLAKKNINAKKTTTERSVANKTTIKKMSTTTKKTANLTKGTTAKTVKKEDK